MSTISARGSRNSPSSWTTNPIERVSDEIERRTEVFDIFLNDEAITRLVGAILIEQKENGRSSVPAT